MKTSMSQGLAVNSANNNNTTVHELKQVLRSSITVHQGFRWILVLYELMVLMDTVSILRVTCCPQLSCFIQKENHEGYTKGALFLCIRVATESYRTTCSFPELCVLFPARKMWLYCSVGAINEHKLV